MSSNSRMMATRQPMRMAVGLPSALATGCWPLGSSSGGGRGVRTAGGFSPKLEGAQGGAAAQDPPGGGRRPQGCSPKLVKLVGGGPGGHQGAGGKVPPSAGEESFTASGEKKEKTGSQTGGETQGDILQETQGTQSPVRSGSRVDTQHMSQPIRRVV